MDWCGLQRRGFVRFLTEEEAVEVTLKFTRDQLPVVNEGETLQMHLNIRERGQLYDANTFDLNQA